MKNKLGWSRCITCLLLFFALISCSSTKNRTEERAKERVIQFLRLMSANQIEEAEKLLSRQLLEGENKELFLNAYDNWQLKDSSIVIQVTHITFEDDKNIGEASIHVRNEKLGFTKIATLAIKFERGDWYIGG